MGARLASLHTKAKFRMINLYRFIVLFLRSSASVFTLARARVLRITESVAPLNVFPSSFFTAARASCNPSECVEQPTDRERGRERQPGIGRQTGIKYTPCTSCSYIQNFCHHLRNCRSRRATDWQRAWCVRTCVHQRPFESAFPISFFMKPILEPCWPAVPGCHCWQCIHYSTLCVSKVTLASPEDSINSIDFKSTLPIFLKRL